jgi:hypothetical protein
MWNGLPVPSVSTRRIDHFRFNFDDRSHLAETQRMSLGQPPHGQKAPHFGKIRADRGLISIPSTILWMK